MKSRKLNLLLKAKRSGLFDLARRRSAPALRILCYHGVWLGNDGFTGDAMFMRPAAFARRMQLLRQWGYPVISLDEAIACRSSGRQTPPNAVVITIDDGWYGTYRHMIPVIRQHALPATLYCDTANLLAGDDVPHVMTRYLKAIAAAQPSRHHPFDAECEVLYRRGTDLMETREFRRDGAERLASRLGVDIASYRDARAFQYMTPAELRDAHGNGLSVELHTHNHTIGDMSVSAIAEEIRLNRAALSEILAKPAESFRHFCYPSGRASAAAAANCSGIGLASTTTTEQGLAWPGAPLHLLPRLLDNENHTEIEFEAELSGFADILRAGKKRLGALMRHRSSNADPASLRNAA